VSIPASMQMLHSGVRGGGLPAPPSDAVDAAVGGDGCGGGGSCGGGDGCSGGDGCGGGDCGGGVGCGGCDGGAAALFLSLLLLSLFCIRLYSL